MRYPNLEAAFRRRGMKADIARAIGASESHIGRIARGESLPSLPLMKAIAKAMNQSIDFLLAIEEPADWEK